VETTPEGIKIHRLVFLSRIVQTANGPDSSLVFAAIAFPATKGSYPAIVRLHGGGGTADIPAAIGSAKAGYVSLVLDIPGIAGNKQSPKNKGFWKTRSKMTAIPDVTYSSLFDAVLASAQSVYLLRVQPDVNPAKMGVAGASWGGYVATMVSCLLNKDLAATWSVFGSGNFLLGSYEMGNLKKLPQAERDEWTKYLDPGSRAQNITKPFHISTASNDRHWSWMAVQATLAQMKGPVSQMYSPNTNHLIKCPGGSAMIPFFNQYLKGGAPVPEIVNVKTNRKSDGSIQVLYEVVNAVDPVTPRVYFTSPEVQPVWTERIWEFVPAKPAGKGYEATIPASRAKGLTDLFTYMTDHNPSLGQDSTTVTSLVLEIK
ncbi:MAG: acetylxylan esterase, partial [Bacteroidales bacterium]|nr:acetylxylan esterase [Bacteroidales bacterium]